MRTLLPLFVCFVTGCLFGCRNENAARQIISQAESLFATHPDSTYILLDSISLPENLSDPLLARWCMLYGQAADTLHEEMPYVHQLQRALTYYKKRKAKREEAQIGFYLGRSYVEDKEYEKAADAYLAAIEVATQAKNYNQIGAINSYLGDLYDFKEMFDLAVDKYKKSAAAFQKEGNTRKHISALRNLSRTYAFMDSCQTALKILQRADSSAIQLKDSLLISDIWNALGNVYTMMGDLDLAEKYQLNALRYDSTDMAPCYLSLSEIYRKKKDFNKAREYITKAAIPSENKYVTATSLYHSYLTEKEDNNIEKALSYFEQYEAIEDSIILLQNKADIINAEKRYDHLKLLSENIRLKIDKQREITLLAFSIILILLLLVIYLISSKKKNKKIYEQQKALDEKDIHLLNLSLSLQKEKSELESLSSQLEESKKQIYLQQSLHNQEELYARKKEEVESLEKELIRLRREKLQATPIAKKIYRLSSKVIPGNTQPLLTGKDWNTIVKTIDDIYLSFSNKLLNLNYNLTPTEIEDCYLTFFELDTTAQAILLGIAPYSVSKRRQRLRHKLNINNQNIELGEYFTSL